MRRDSEEDDPSKKPKEIPREPIKGTHDWNPKVTPERNAVDYLHFDKKGTEKLRDLGFTSALVVPGRGIFRGESALIDLADDSANDAVVAPSVAPHIAFELPEGRRRETSAEYPTSLMGCIALVRQTFLDADWYQRAQDAYKKAPATTERPEDNASLAALVEFAKRKEPSLFEAEDELDLLRILRLADEFKLKPIIYGNGYEYRVRKSLGKTPIILPLDFPKVPEIENPLRAIEYDLDELQHWDRAPSNPALLAAAGIPIAFTTEKLEKPDKEFWSRVRLVVRRGLNKDAALAALTTAPAEMFGVADRLGTIEKGRIANLVVANGDLFSADDARVLTTWVDGKWYDTDRADNRDPRGTWEVSANGKTISLSITGELDKPEAKIGDDKLSIWLKDDSVTLVAPAKVFVVAGGADPGNASVRLSGRIAANTMNGSGEGPNEYKINWSAKRTRPTSRRRKTRSPRPSINRSIFLKHFRPARLAANQFRHSLPQF